MLPDSRTLKIEQKQLRGTVWTEEHPTVWLATTRYGSAVSESELTAARGGLWHGPPALTLSGHIMRHAQSLRIRRGGLPLG